MACGLIGVSLAAPGPVGCSSVYHDAVRQRSESGPDWLASRAEESLEMHRDAAGALTRAAAAFDDRWLREHPLILWKRLEESRYRASGQVWEARKRTASIGDVLERVGRPGSGAPPGEIDAGRRARAERAMQLLDGAGDRLEESLAGLSEIVDGWKGELTPDDFDPGTISAPLAGLEALLDEASAEVVELRRAP